MSFPLRHTVGVHLMTQSGMDAHRNPVKTYRPPLNQPGTPVKVYGWSVPDTLEPIVPGHERVMVDVQLLVPPGFPAVASSVIDLPAGQFQVIGEQQDYTNGPFAFRPGGVLHLRRITG